MAKGIDFIIKRSKVKQIVADVPRDVKKSVQEISKDLKRTASETAPHFKGILEKHGHYRVKTSGGNIFGEVGFSVLAKNGKDYAIIMHEWNYNLGERSRRKTGGIGMSGKQYPVGNKYLTRVLEGESNAYTKFIGESLKRVLK